MKEAFQEFAENTFWFWTVTVIVSIAIGYVVNLYTNLTWGIVHGVLLFLIGTLIYGISKPIEE